IGPHSIGPQSMKINENKRQTWHYNIAPAPHHNISYQWLTPHAHASTVEDQSRGANLLCTRAGLRFATKSTYTVLRQSAKATPLRTKNRYRALHLGHSSQLRIV